MRLEWALLNTISKSDRSAFKYLRSSWTGLNSFGVQAGYVTFLTS